MRPSRYIGCVVVLLLSTRAFAQDTGTRVDASGRFIDLANGLSLDQAIARALGQEPSLRAARADVDIARAMRLQARLRPNPSLSLEQRTEPGGMDRQTTAGVQWPLDLFRRVGRTAVADREIASTQFSAADRERLLAADVRSRYGMLVATVRELSILDELVGTVRKQHDLLRSRAEEGASPPLERDLVQVELRRLESEQFLLMGRAEAALIALKQVLGIPADATLRVRDSLEQLVLGEGRTRTPALSDSDRAVRRPDVLEAASRIDVAAAKADLARRNARFDVTVVANYMWMNAGFPQHGVAADGTLMPIRGAFHYLSIGATISVPLLDRNEGEIAAARAEQQRAIATHEAATLAAAAEIASARVQDQAARQAVEVFSGGAHALARANLSIVRQSYELGRVTVFEVLAEQRRYLDIERAYTSALQAAFEARSALLRALGDMR